MRGVSVMKKIVSLVIVVCMLLTCSISLSMVAYADDNYIINGVTLPLPGYENGAASYGPYQCWAFAQHVYQTVWGVSFSSYRNTSDDMLRSVGDGSARAITEENTVKFISAAAPGATIRVQSSNLDGGDCGASHLHSMILVSKDNNGFVFYDSTNACIHFKYITWSGFINYCGSCKYFKYIKWPGAAAFSEFSSAPTNVTLQLDKSSYALSDTVTFLAAANQASYFTLSVQDGNGNTVFSNFSGFSSTQSWKPESAGTYTAHITAINTLGATDSTTVTFDVYDSKPGVLEVSVNNSSASCGQEVDIIWAASKFATDYWLTITRNGAEYYSAKNKDMHYIQTFPSGNYTAVVTASNPYGSTIGTAIFSVKDCTDSGKIGNNISWSIDTASGVLALTGSGATYDEANLSSSPWSKYSVSINTLQLSEGITAIGNYLLSGLSVKEIVLPDSLQSIGNYAFYSDNSTNTKVGLPHSLKSIGVQAFGNSNISEAECCFTHDTAPTFGTGAFPSNCTLTFPDSAIIDMNTGLGPFGYKEGVVARWIVLHFDPNGGVLPNPEEYYAADWVKQYPTMQTPTMKGFVFAGWYTAPIGGVQVKAGDLVTKTKGYTLYAHWNPNNYTVNFDASGGETPTENKSVIHWTDYGTLPVPDKEATVSLSSADDASLCSATPVQITGYKFAGWYTAEDGGKLVTNDTLVDLTGNETLYAHWEDYNIAFQNAYIDGNTITYSITNAAAGKTAKLLTSYYNDSNRFLGCAVFTVDVSVRSNSIPVTYSGDYKYCKLFLLDPTDASPICEPLQILRNEEYIS
jgi:uncharacterized repeat protein (TIGR02543 family)